jgi:hypothetical protein
VSRSEGSAAPHGGETAIPVILAERQGVLFVAAPESAATFAIPERHRAAGTQVVPLFASPEEAAAAGIAAPAEPGGWRWIAPRADLLAPALARLLAGEQQALTLRPGRDGLKATLVSATGERRPYPIAAKDALALLAAVLQAAPRGVVRAGGAQKTRLLLDVRPGIRPMDYSVRLAGLSSLPPGSLAEAGMAPAVLELFADAGERRAGLWLVTGGGASGRSTTLDLLGRGLAGRGLRGGRIGRPREEPGPEAAWLASSLLDWPFPAALKDASPGFVLVDECDLAREIGIAARLAALGTRVVAALPSFEPSALAARVARALEDLAAPRVPLLIVTQALVRTVCPACLEWHVLAHDESRSLGLHPRDTAEFARQDGLAVPRGRGCGACGGTGFAGITGVFACTDPDDPTRRRPTLREEGWRKVFEGAAWYEDVAALDGGSAAMAPLREIAALSGALPAPVSRRANPAPASATRGAAGTTAATGAGAPPPGSAEVDAQELMRLVRNAATGSAAPGDRLAALAATLAGRAAHGRLAGLLAEGDSGSPPALHAVNTALVAVRLVTALGQGEDGPATALLALVHDAALFGDDASPDVTASIRTLGIEDRDTLRRIGEVRGLLASGQAPGSDRADADLRAQAVALAALIHRAYLAGRTRGLDLHDITSSMMVDHGRSFSPLLFRALLRAIPIFPIGCLVELSSGDLARVVSQNDENHFRPRVEITSARGAGAAAGEARVVDLARAPFLHIRHRVAAAARGAEGARA